MVQFIKTFSSIMNRSYENYFLQAQKIRGMIQSDFDRVFKRPNPLHLINKESSKSDEKVDVLITPVAISTAPKIEECLATNVNENNNFVNAYVNDVLTIPASLAGKSKIFSFSLKIIYDNCPLNLIYIGIPAISVPFGVSLIDNYPIGLQLMTQYGDDESLFGVAKVLEKGANQK
jgi:aspartyl-tRNA(Asn)/glutamyl-tRNA(Gln) amidotransferase subunit A